MKRFQIKIYYNHKYVMVIIERSWFLLKFNKTFIIFFLIHRGLSFNNFHSFYLKQKKVKTCSGKLDVNEFDLNIKI